MADAPRILSEIQLAGIEALAAAATPGPWSLYGWAGHGEGAFIVQMQPPGRARRDIVRGGCDSQYDVAMGVLTNDDAAFIIICREYVPALVAMVRAAEAERDAARAVLVWFEWAAGGYCATCFGTRVTSHAADCALGRALGRPECHT